MADNEELVKRLRDRVADNKDPREVLFLLADAIEALSRAIPAQTREAVLEEAAIDPVDNAFEQAAREWKFEQIGAEFVVNYVADRVEDFIASPESQVSHRFASRAQALRFRRRKCLEAAIRALASPAPEPKQGEDGWIEVLRNLTNSADGLSFREDAIRNIVGNTNWRILRDHIAADRAILPAAPTSTESRE